MSAYILILRTIHIVAGTLWVGSAVFYLLFVEPSAKSLGPSAPKFMQTLIERRRYPLFMNVVASLTIIAGGLLYWPLSGGLNSSWITSGPGLGLTVGALVALVVYGIGFFMIRPRADHMGRLGREIAANGGPPTPEQVAELAKIEAELTSIGRVDALLLIVALVFMASARYWIF